MLLVKSNGVPTYAPRAVGGEALTSAGWRGVGVSRGGRVDRNPNAVGEQDYLFVVPLAPREGAPRPTPMGPVAVAANGVPLYNQFAVGGADAVDDEAFDTCCGHPAGGARYHYHQFPRCVRGAAALGTFVTDEALAKDLKSPATKQFASPLLAAALRSTIARNEASAVPRANQISAAGPRPTSRIIQLASRACSCPADDPRGIRGGAATGP